MSESESPSAEIGGTKSLPDGATAKTPEGPEFAALRTALLTWIQISGHPKNPTPQDRAVETAAEQLMIARRQTVLDVPQDIDAAWKTYRDECGGLIQNAQNRAAAVLRGLEKQTAKPA